ncbi:MAG TPA: Hsp20/alpha crystallin family protein [Myxococcales bacterium]|nr:Hsp20/alpha crystallin family protein [Myxococcales bacterium]
MLVHKEPERFLGFPMLRSLMEWEPMRELAPLFEKGERELGEFTPRFDVKETKEAFLVKADLPGVAEKDIEVTVSGARLTVSGKREEEKKEKGDVYYTWERSCGIFTRSFKLPEGVDLEHIEAELKGGVLTIVAPKKAGFQPRKVTVKSVIEKVKGALGKEEVKA